MREDQTIALPDGRILGFSEFGDLEGTPVVFFHGTPGSRVLGRISEQWARDARVRLVATDRPGYGLSTFQPGRAIIDHASDVSTLCDELGIDRFAVVGVSGGAPYVLGCASALPDRVSAGAVISGFYGMDPPVDTSLFTDEVAAHFTAIRNDPEVSRPNLDQIVPMLSGVDAQQFMLQQMAGAPAHILDLVAADRSIGEIYAAHHIEGQRAGSDGAVYELGLTARPWGFDFASITPEIRIWHGGKDAVPRGQVEAVAATLPHASVSWHEEYGHADCVFFMPEILAWLTEPARSPVAGSPARRAAP